MENSCADKHTKSNEERGKNDADNYPEPCADHSYDWIPLVPTSDRAKENIPDNTHNNAGTSANQSVEKRLAKAPFLSHVREGNCRIEQHQLHRFEKGGEDAELLSALPWQTS